MIKLSKKLILFCILILDLSKQLVVGLSIFLYNRTLGTRVGAFIGIGAVALAFLFAMFVWAPSAMMADTSQMNKSDDSVSVKQEISNLRENQISDEDNLLANNLQDNQLAKDAGEFLDLDAINFQATEYNPAAVGRSEPFAPRNSGSSSMLNGPNAIPGSEGSTMSAEELAAQEAEKRRNEISSTIGSDITIKGIIFNENGTDPMAIVEYVSGDGDTKVKTVVPGDVLDLSICEATIVEIAKNTIDVKSEDVRKRKYLPNFEDESEGSAVASDDSSESSGSGDNLMPPPVPTGGANQGNDSSMTDAKKKIEEIDKLLDSF